MDRQDQKRMVVKKNKNVNNNTLSKTNNFSKKFADNITDFDPSSDTLEIDTDSFGIDNSATFATTKNKRKLKKLTKKDFDFLYDQKKGGLYFTSTRMAQTKALAMVASLPSSKVLLI